MGINTTCVALAFILAAGAGEEWDLSTQANIQAGKYAEAELTALQALEAGLTLERWSSLAAIEEKLSNIDQARGAWEEAIKLAPRNSRPHESLAALEWRIGKKADAKTRFAKAAELGGCDSDLCKQVLDKSAPRVESKPDWDLKAEREFKAGKLAEAEISVLNAIESKPTVARFLKLADVQIGLGNADTALAAADQAAELAPQNPAPSEWKGVYFFKQDKLKEAKIALERAAALNGCTTPLCRETLASLRRPAAQAPALPTPPVLGDEGRSWERQAEREFTEGEFAKSEISMLRALEAKPTVERWLRLADIQVRSGNASGALAAIDQAIQMAAGDPRPIEWQGAYYLQNGQNSRARQHFEKAARMGGCSPACLGALARMEMPDNAERAMMWLDAALSIKGSDPELNLLRAEAASAQRKYAVADASALVAAQSKPWRETATRRLLVTAKRRGDADLAAYYASRLTRPTLPERFLARSEPPWGMLLSLYERSKDVPPQALRDAISEADMHVTRIKSAHLAYQRAIDPSSDRLFVALRPKTSSGGDSSAAQKSIAMAPFFVSEGLLVDGRAFTSTVENRLRSEANLNFVERRRIEALLMERRMQLLGLSDTPSAQADVGRILGAGLIITGSLQGESGRIRADSRVVDVESGQIMLTATAFADQGEDNQLAVQLADDILNQLRANEGGSSVRTGAQTLLGSDFSGAPMKVSEVTLKPIFGWGMDVTDAAEFSGRISEAVAGAGWRVRARAPLSMQALVFADDNRAKIGVWVQDAHDQIMYARVGTVPKPRLSQGFDSTLYGLLSEVEGREMPPPMRQASSELALAANLILPGLGESMRGRTALSIVTLAASAACLGAIAAGTFSEHPGMKKARTPAALLYLGLNLATSLDVWLRD